MFVLLCIHVFFFCFVSCLTPNQLKLFLFTKSLLLDSLVIFLLVHGVAIACNGLIPKAAQEALFVPMYVATEMKCRVTSVIKKCCVEAFMVVHDGNQIRNYNEDMQQITPRGPRSRT